MNNNLPELQYLNFVPNSSDYVSQVSVHAGTIPDRVGEEFSQLQTESLHNGRPLCGIFADEMIQNVVTRIYNYQLDYIRLDGNESPTYIRNLRATVIPDIRPNLKIIKRLHAEDVAAAYTDCVDYIL